MSEHSGTSDTADRVAEIVEAALESDRGSWPALLDERCGNNSRVRTEVESLLRYHEQAADLIEEPAVHADAEFFAEEDGALKIGEVVDQYRVLSLLGAGGMGEVYLAEDVSLGRQVALKLVKRGAWGRDLLRHFRAEERILAALTHPNIARLYGAAVTGEGAPFFVMEYVAGERLDDYCSQRQLGLAERLQLFRKICSAVAYAHQHLIIHRDLKPANIRVTSEGEPKLLDFGIAKLLETGDAAPPAQTVTLADMMTPEYASPEQVRGGTMTTSSDVYSLGVILYEMLSGEKPYRLTSRRPADVVRAITDTVPARPSTATSADGRWNAADRKALRGDLDNIVLMALRKEPERRYSSVAQFSGDIGRHLEGLPVIAHKDSISYRAAKFIKRNKLGVAAALIVALTLIGGVIGTAWQAKRATEQAGIAAEQRDRARMEAAKSARINDFLQHVLGFAQVSWLSPNPQKKNVSTIAEALDEASRRAEQELADQPELLAAVQYTLGNSYFAQGKLEAAAQHLRASVEHRRKALGPEHPETVQSMISLAEQFIFQGKFGDAETLSRDAVTVHRRLQDRGEANPRWFASALNILGVSIGYRGDAGAAEALFAEALKVGATLTGVDRGMIAVIYSNIAIQRGNQGDVDGAVDYLRKSIDEMRALPDKPLSNIATTLSNLGSFMTIQRDYAGADAVLRESLDLNRETVGEKHIYTVMALIYLATNYCDQGDYSRALEEVNRAIVIQQEILQEGHIDFGRSWSVLGKILTRMGNVAEGEEHLRNALNLRARALKPGHTAIATSQGLLGECLTAQKRFEEAEPLLLESHIAIEKTLSARDPRTENAKARLVELYEAWGKPEKAVAFRDGQHATP